MPKKFTNRPNVNGLTSIFNQDLFDKYDKKARDIVKMMLPNNINDNPNIYGEDLILYGTKTPYKYIEVQVCGVWKSDKYPYKCPFVYARKMKFSKYTLFITFNNTYTKFIMFSYNVISKIPSRLKKYDREMVNYVSWYNACLLDVNDLTLENIYNYAGVEYIDDIIDNNIVPHNIPSNKSNNIDNIDNINDDNININNN
jgi:hypothetical protein